MRYMLNQLNTVFTLDTGENNQLRTQGRDGVDNDHMGLTEGRERYCDLLIRFDCGHKFRDDRL